MNKKTSFPLFPPVEEVALVVIRFLARKLVLDIGSSGFSVEEY